MLNLYRALIDLRRTSAALSVGSYRQVFVDDDLLVFARRHAEQERLVALNLSDSPRRLPAGIGPGRKTVLSTYLDAGEPGVLRPDEGLVLE
jgi:alpha-glucosidase